MAWCPKCKCEYVEGIKTCADCGSELVDELPDEKQMEIAETSFLAYDIDFLSEHLSEGLPEEALEEEEEQEKEAAPAYQHFYVNNEEKAEDNKTSAYTLLTIGSLGLLVIILIFFDVIPIYMSVTNKYIVTGVMGVMFLLFIVMGCVSFKNSRILFKKASKENNLTTEIKKWCVNNLQMQEIDQKLELTDQPEELKYFQRATYMRTVINKQFMNLDESYLDRLIDEVYPEIFEGDISE